jgi:hypothetical protein
MHSIVSSVRKSVVCRSSNAKEQTNNAKHFEKPKKIFNDFHKKRAETLKLSSNNFVKVSQEELNEDNSFLKELDAFHREQFNEIKNALDSKVKEMKKSKAGDKEAKTEAVESETDSSVVEEENIFLKKD